MLPTRIHWLDHRCFVPACLLLFGALRLALILGAPVAPESDAAWYYHRAAGEGYQHDGTPTAYWPVGYPGVLGVWVRATETRARFALNGVLFCVGPPPRWSCHGALATTSY